MKSDAELADLLQPTLQKHNIEADKIFIEKVCNAMKERAVFIHDLYEMGYYFFEEIKTWDEASIRKKWKKDNTNLFRQLIEKLDSLDNFTAHEIEGLVKNFMSDNKLNMGEIMPVFRVALAGGLQGPPVFYNDGYTG